MHFQVSEEIRLPMETYGTCAGIYLMVDMFLSYLKAPLSTKLMDGCNKIQEYEWSVAKVSNRKQS